MDPLLRPHAEYYSGCAFQLHLVQPDTGASSLLAVGACPPWFAIWLNLFLWDRMLPCTGAARTRALLCVRVSPAAEGLSVALQRKPSSVLFFSSGCARLRGLQLLQGTLLGACPGSITQRGDLPSACHEHGVRN